MTSFKDARSHRQARQAPHAHHGVARSIAHEIPAHEDEQVHNEAELPPLISRADKVQAGMAQKPAPLADLSRQLRLDDAYLQVRSTSNAGRALYAKRQYRAGAVIYTSPACPPATALSTQHLTTHCSSCFLSAEDAAVLRKRNEESMKRCGACRIVHYCSSACQLADWPAHKPECASLNKLRAKYAASHAGAAGTSFVPHESVRAIGRLFWDKQRAREEGRDAAAWDQYRILQSYLDPDADKLEALREQVYRTAYYISLATNNLELTGEMALAMLMKEYGISGNAELEMMKIISRYQVNAFTLDSPDLSALGVTVNPALGMANHSCDPNAVVVFPTGGGIGQLTAIRAIQPDEEITICYTDVAEPRHLRQDALRKRYNFGCVCSVCTKDGSLPDPRWCLRHKWREEHVARIPYGVESKVAKLDVAVRDTVRCSCGESFAVDTGRLQQVMTWGKDLLEADERGEYDAANADIDTALMRLQTCVATLLQTCPASTYPVVSLSRLIVRLLTVRPINTIKALAPVLKHLLDAQTGAEAIYTPHHPTLAVLAAQKARLLGVELVEEDRVQHVQLLLKRGVTPQDVMVLQGMGIVGEASRLRAAVEAYREAIKRCQGCFGPKGGVLAAKLEREMQVVQMDMAASGRAMLS